MKESTLVPQIEKAYKSIRHLLGVGSAGTVTFGDVNLSRFDVLTIGGVVTTEDVLSEMTSQTEVISLSWSSGLTGVLNPIEDIVKVCHDAGVAIHIDVSHAIGCLHWDEGIDADFISFRGEQIHCLQGTCATYKRERGTVNCDNIPGLVALGRAAEESAENRDLMCTEVVRLRDKFERGITEGVSGAVVFFSDSERLPYCTAIGFPGVHGEALSYVLAEKGVFCGCEVHKLEKELVAAGIDAVLARSSLNFGLSRYTTEEDVDRAVKIICDSAVRLQKMSERL